MSEVSQLNEMNTVLIASKEDNDKKRHEAHQMAAKIAELEKQLEDGVAFTNRYRATKTAATGGLRRRLQALDDLFLKLDHVAKQTSDMYISRIAAMAEGVQEQERAAAQGTRDVTAAFERLNVMISRHRECSEQEANIKTLSAAKTSTENEIEELAARIKELDTLSKIEDEETAIADAARRATLAATQSRQAEKESLENRLTIACDSLQVHMAQIAHVRAEMEAVDRAWNDDAEAIAIGMKSVASQAQMLELRLAELSADITCQTVGELSKLEAEQATLAQVGPRTTMDLEEVKRQYKQVHPEVAEMRTQLVEKRQRYQILGDQLAASQKAISAHSVNQPEFDTRKTEHKELSSSIAGLRSAGTDAAARKSSLDGDTKSARLEAEAAITEIKGKIATFKKSTKDGESIVAARNEAAACVLAAQTALTNAKKELASVQELLQATLVALDKQHLVEQELRNTAGERDSAHAEQITRCENAIVEQRMEAGSISQRVENLTKEFEAAKARAAEECQRRAEAAKEALLTEVMAHKVGAMTAEIEVTYAEELKRMQDEIVCEDTRLRAAWTDTSNSTSCGGAEERLQMDLSDLSAEEAVIRSEVEAAELRVQRLKDTTSGERALSS